MDNYHMITNRIAIGNFESPYELFDVIINLNFPYNGVNHHEIRIEDYLINGKKHFYIRVGILDAPEENQFMYQVLKKIIPILIDIYQNQPYSILFHCFAGISRSSTLAIALIACIENISVDEAYRISKQKRFIVNPNVGFYQTLKKYLQTS